MTEDELKNIEARCEASWEIVRALCKPRNAPGAREWFMSIPARDDYDPDLIIGDSLGDIPDLVAALRQARELLTALVASTPLYDPIAHYLGCCGSPFYNAHKRDCPWLMAKQYLEKEATE